MPIFNAIPKFSKLEVLRIVENSEAQMEEIKQFFHKYNKKPHLIKSTAKGIVVRFTNAFRATLTPGSIMFFDGSRFNYILADDACVFEEFFFDESDAHSIDVCDKNELGWRCKNCGIYYDEPFADKCPTCGIDRVALITKIQRQIRLNTKKQYTEKARVVPERFVCPQCNFASESPFDVCPNCSYTGLSEQFTPLKKLTEKKKMDLAKIREEQEAKLREEKANTTEVTAVYGDCVAVDNSEVSTNVEEKENQETSGV